MKLFDTDNYRLILWRKFLPWLIQNGAQKNRMTIFWCT